MSTPLAITSTGAASSVGGSADATCASIRAGVNLFREYPHYLGLPTDPEWGDEEPILSARAPFLPDVSHGGDRMLELAQRALLEALPKSGMLRADLPRTALLLALPREDAVVAEWRLSEFFARAVCGVTQLDSMGHVESLAGGHSGALLLVDRARALLTSGTVDRAFLVGVDSLIDVERLGLLDRDYRIKSERGVDGAIPGEAAAALCLTTAAFAGDGALALVGAVGTGTEPNLRDSDQASTGAGLQAALATALAGSPSDSPPNWVLCDLNGETYRSFEWGLALGRLGDGFGPVEALDHPVDCTGDVGAASGALLMTLAANAFAHQRAPHSSALVWTASDDATRAALCLQAPAQ